MKNIDIIYLYDNNVILFLKIWGFYEEIKNSFNYVD